MMNYENELKEKIKYVNQKVKTINEMITKQTIKTDFDLNPLNEFGIILNVCKIVNYPDTFNTFIHLDKSKINSYIELIIDFIISLRNDYKEKISNTHILVWSYDLLCFLNSVENGEIKDIKIQNLI